MKSKRFIAFWMAAGLLVMTGVLGAHHAGTIYDRDNPVTFEGTVAEYRFLNPHTEIVFEVKDEKGTSTIWRAWSGPPAALYRRGWNAETLKPGDKITVSGFPTRSGAKVMSVRRLVGPGGQELTQGAE